MANEQNLRPIRNLTKEEAKKRGSAGGKKSVEARREKKLFKTVIEEQLGNTIENIVAKMIDEAANKGNVQAATWLRDTAGQKPIDKVEAQVQQTTINVKLDDEE